MNIFNSIPLKKVKRNNFNLSHIVRTSLQMGNLTPVLCLPVLPNDTFTVSNNVVIRLAPQLAPVMADVDVYCHYFFVPWRIIWDEYSEFMTGGETGNSLVVFPRVRFEAGDYSNNPVYEKLFCEGSLFDFLGYPIFFSSEYGADAGKIAKEFSVSELPLRAYAKIYNEYYRDQNVEGEIPINTGSGSHPFSATSLYPHMYQMRTRAWAKDYFTSALPEPQRGPDVPLFDVNGSGEAAKIVFDPEGRTRLRRPSSGADVPNDSYLTANYSSFDGGTVMNAASESGEVGPANVDNSSNLKIQGGNLDIQAPTMNDLRRRMSLQRFLEITNRSGARLKEFILGHFGAVIPDSTLQRPLYLGGGAQKILFTDVIQNSASVSDDNTGFDNTSLGQTAGYGICTGSTGRFRHHFTEHGYVMCIMSIRPRADYYPALDRHLTKFDRFDHAFPEFANLGEQEIYNRELYFNPTKLSPLDDPNGTFGYTPRYAEYKFMNNRIHGSFRSSLSYWHLARRFDGEPGLNEGFIHVNPSDDNRIFAVQSTDLDPVEHYYASIRHNIIVKRCLPKYGIPSFL